MNTIWSRMLLLFIYVRRWRLSCIVAVYCKYSFTMGSPWPFLSRIRYPAVSSTRSYIVNLASPPIFIPHPNQHTNRISLSYTLAYAIYCGQMMHIWRLWAEDGRVVWICSSDRKFQTKKFIGIKLAINFARSFLTLFWMSKLHEWLSIYVVHTRDYTILTCGIYQLYRCTDRSAMKL